jgi:NADPH:quinone reductase-like Zn-dependent oxidoreductase
MLNLYGAMSALVFHLHLNKPSAMPDQTNVSKKVMIWGTSSVFGANAVQITARAGYLVLGVASGSNAVFVRLLGSTKFVDRSNSLAPVTEKSLGIGPFQAVLAPADSAKDQEVVRVVWAAQGGGTFLFVTGMKEGVKLPDRVAR